MKKIFSSLITMVLLAAFLPTSTVSAANACEGDLSNPKSIQNLKKELNKTYNENSAKKSRKYQVKYPASFSLEKVDGEQDGTFIGSIMIIGKSDLQGLPIVSINPSGEGQYYMPPEDSKIVNLKINGKKAKWTSWWVHIGDEGCFEQGEIRLDKTPKGWTKKVPDSDPELVISGGYINYAAKSADIEIVKNIINSIKVN